MVQAGYDYLRSSEWEYNQISPEIKKNPRKKSKPKAKKIRSLYVKAGILLLIYAFILVYLTFQSSSLGYEIVTLEKEIERLHVSNDRLNYEIAQISSLDAIQMRAQALGMKKPDMKESMAIPLSALQVAEDKPKNTIQNESKKPLEKLYASIMSIKETNQLKI